jgi:Flp pilus assembly protein TadG
MSRRKQRGTSAVEFAIVLPLLLVVLFAIIEFSIALFNQAVMTNATREGARAGIVYRLDESYDRDPLSSDEIEDVINDYIGNHLMSLQCH